MRATQPGGQLEPVPFCQISIPGFPVITLNNLPEISDSKGASYQDEVVIGRAFPIKTFSHGDNRSISMKVHFFILSSTDAVTNMGYLRAIQSAVYPRDNVTGSPYLPPPICQLRCGNLLTGTQTDGWICAVLKSYSVSYDPTVAWFEDGEGNGSYLPYKFDMDLSWEVVYSNTNLPGQEKIMKDI
jgi:hypothetical protein